MSDDEYGNDEFEAAGPPSKSPRYNVTSPNEAAGNGTGTAPNSYRSPRAATLREEEGGNSYHSPRAPSCNDTSSTDGNPSDERLNQTAPASLTKALKSHAPVKGGKNNIPSASVQPAVKSKKEKKDEKKKEKKQAKKEARRADKRGRKAKRPASPKFESRLWNGTRSNFAKSVEITTGTKAGSAGMFLLWVT